MPLYLTQHKHQSIAGRRSQRASPILLLAMWLILPLWATKILALPNDKPSQLAHIAVVILQEFNSHQPGHSQRIGLLLKPAPGWHVYWQNPGDSGNAPIIKWLDIPQGVTIGEFQWPIPKQIKIGHLVNYGYHDAVLLMLPVTLPPDIQQQQLMLKGKASWLVCKESCIPGWHTFTVALTISTDKPIPNGDTTIFEQTDKTLPVPVATLDAHWQLTDNAITLKAYANKPLFSQSTTLTFFPITANIVEYAQPIDIQWKHNVVTIGATKHVYFNAKINEVDFILVDQAKRGWQLSANRQ